MTIDYFKEAEFLLRILLAAVCGGIVGYERKNRGKGAGIRTHLIVAVASCLMMIVSQYGFADFFNFMDSQGLEIQTNPSRIAAQIVSGVGFLGAGMIFVQKKMVTGLTTAAGIWAVSGIGMAIGGGMYFLGISCSVIIVIIQILLHRNISFLHLSNEESFTIILRNEDGALEHLKELFLENGISASISGFTKKEEYLEISLTATIPHGFDISPVFMTLERENNILSLKA